jgi:hypothetical protein
LWAIRVDLSEAIELNFSNAEHYGLLREDLTGENYEGCRRFADSLRENASASKALVVPSAALPGTRSLVLLGERIGIPFDWRPLGSIDLPTAILGEGSSPPPGIASLVRYRGDPDPELEAWEEGRRYQFKDRAL